MTIKEVRDMGGIFSVITNDSIKRILKIAEEKCTPRPWVSAYGEASYHDPPPIQDSNFPNNGKQQILGEI